MPTVKELYSLFDGLLPRSLSASWDNDGLMLAPDKDKEVKAVVFALDVTPAVVDFAEKTGAELILSHHPLIFKGLRHIDGNDSLSAAVLRLIKKEIAVMSFHTRLDAVEGGVNDILADILTLKNTARFGPAGEEMGIVGDLPRPMDFSDFCLFVKEKLNAPAVTAAKGASEIVKKVAVLGGSGRDFIESAAAAGADVFVTGEGGYHPMTEAARGGLSVVEAGHFYTEQYFYRYFEKLLREKYPALALCRFDGGCELTTY